MTEGTSSSMRGTARKSRKRKNPVISREVNISDWELEMFSHTVTDSNPEHRRHAETYLIVKGTLTEPFNGSSPVVAQIYAEDAPRIGLKKACCSRPRVNADVNLTHFPAGAPK